MQAWHAIVNRDYFDHLPDRRLIEDYTKILSELPLPEGHIIRQHLRDSFLEFYCRCGCHSFFVQPRQPSNLYKRRDYNGLYKEIVFRTNYPEELNLMLFLDDSGLLSQVTIFFGQNNLEPIPKDISIIGINEIW